MWICIAYFALTKNVCINNVTVVGLASWKICKWLISRWWLKQNRGSWELRLVISSSNWLVVLRSQIRVGEAMTSHLKIKNEFNYLLPVATNADAAMTSHHKPTSSKNDTNSNEEFAMCRVSKLPTVCLMLDHQFWPLLRLFRFEGSATGGSLQQAVIRQLADLIV